MKTTLTAAFAAGIMILSGSAMAQDVLDKDVAPTGKGNAIKASGNGIFYHGGPLMGTSAPAKMYYIWYGNWSNNSATTILTNFANNFAPSPYFNIETTYYNGSNVHVINSASLAGSYNDNYSQGSNLTDSSLQAVVTSAITGGHLPSDANAVYLVLTSQDVNETSGFCTQYCGFHTHATIGSTDIKYSFVGNGARCITSCASMNTTISPNGNVGADEMASVIAHEFEEAVSDPDLNAWYDRRGYENADKCAYKYGTTYTTGNGAVANMKLGSFDYLIQQNWLNASGGLCATGL